MADAPTKPDWIAFGKDIMEFWPEGDVECGDLQELAVKPRLLVKVPGGFDPEIHEDFYGCAEPGDPWFMQNY